MDAPAAGFSCELAQGFAEGVTASQFDVAITSRDQHLGVAQFARHEAQEQKRRLVRPVEIVDQDQQGLRFRGAAQVARYGVKESEANLLGIGGRGSDRCTEMLAQLG